MHIIVSIFFLVFTFHIHTANAAISSAKKTNPDTLRMLDLFGDVFDKVKKDYVEEVSDTDLIEAAINGMLTSLDPHSSYLNQKAFEEMKIQTKGEFGGLGIEVTMENGLVKVVSPIDDTPAYVAGIKPGDYISYIEDDAVMGMSLAEAVEKMRGAVGTKVRLTILREGQNEPLELSITREIIKIRSVKAHSEGDIGYIRITSFSEQTDTNLKTEIGKLKKEIGKNIKGIVLDLRNNPGGLLDQAIAVADDFLESGEIVSTRGRLPDSSSRFNAHAGDLTEGLPMAILINGGSASASEIVSGALQDHKRAIIVGTKSFGKGSVQTIIPLPGHGAIRLTTSRYYTPSGRSIQAEGIVPDVIVEPAKIELLEGKDAKRLYSEASLRKHLTGDKKESAKKEAEEADKLKAEKDQGKKPSLIKEKKLINVKLGDQALYNKDYQLSRAIDLLHGIYFFNTKLRKN